MDSTTRVVDALEVRRAYLSGTLADSLARRLAKASDRVAEAQNKAREIVAAKSGADYGALDDQNATPADALASQLDTLEKGVKEAKVLAGEVADAADTADAATAYIAADADAAANVADKNTKLADSVSDRLDTIGKGVADVKSIAERIDPTGLD